MVKLFVGGFPLEMTELELVKMIGPHGDVETIKIVRDKKTRICKGYAFLEMKDRTGAENAVIALDGTPIADRVLSVKINDDNFCIKLLICFGIGFFAGQFAVNTAIKLNL
jgi:RNA recognition motif-containing protein